MVLEMRGCGGAWEGVWHIFLVIEMFHILIWVVVKCIGLYTDKMGYTLKIYILFCVYAIA